MKMRTWIFQSNPDDYDIDGYLASRPPEVVWLVTRYASEITPGDRVYLWRNQGKQQALAGIIAEAIVTTAPSLRGEDHYGIRFWRAPDTRATTPRDRAAMRLIKVASNREIIRRDWCVEDPVLSELPNLRMQAGTNYQISPEQTLRLDALWSRTGRDWTRDESIAGLKAYAETYHLPISRLPESPVGQIALKIGRAVSGVYVKVMNFRSLDPRAATKGMSGGSEIDRAVWREFFDLSSSTLRMNELNSEFKRLWGEMQSDSVNPAEATAIAEIVLQEAERLERSPLESLLAKYAEQGAKDQRPATRILGARIYERNPLVIAIARLRASHQCEVEGCSHPSFETIARVRYTEIHHIVSLSDGGEDTVENVACLCPSHHREIHLGARAAELTAQLKQIRSANGAVGSGDSN
jgi:HNH endonuclease/EVE domain